MENEELKTLVMAIGQLYAQGGDAEAEKLFKAACGLYICGQISIEELHWLNEQMKADTKEHGSVDGAAADKTVLWLRNKAAEAETSMEPLDVLIQRAAEYLHDYWSEIID